jgi:hypothetical protein
MLTFDAGNGKIPCANCLDRKEECRVTGKLRTRVQSDSSHDSTNLSLRVQQLEALLEMKTNELKSQQRNDHYQTSNSPYTLSTSNVSTPVSFGICLTAFINAVKGQILEAQTDQTKANISKPLVFINHNVDGESGVPIRKSNSFSNATVVQISAQEESIVYISETVSKVIKPVWPNILIKFSS